MQKNIIIFSDNKKRAKKISSLFVKLNLDSTIIKYSDLNKLKKFNPIIILFDNIKDFKNIQNNVKNIKKYIPYIYISENYNKEKYIHDNIIYDVLNIDDEKDFKERILTIINLSTYINLKKQSLLIDIKTLLYNKNFFYQVVKQIIYEKERLNYNCFLLTINFSKLKQEDIENLNFIFTTNLRETDLTFYINDFTFAIVFSFIKHEDFKNIINRITSLIKKTLNSKFTTITIEVTKDNLEKILKL